MKKATPSGVRRGTAAHPHSDRSRHADALALAAYDAASLQLEKVGDLHDLLSFVVRTIAEVQDANGVEAACRGCTVLIECVQEKCHAIKATAQQLHEMTGAGGRVDRVAAQQETP